MILVLLFCIILINNTQREVIYHRSLYDFWEDSLVDNLDPLSWHEGLDAYNHLITPDQLIDIGNNFVQVYQMIDTNSVERYDHKSPGVLVKISYKDGTDTSYWARDEGTMGILGDRKALLNLLQGNIMDELSLSIEVRHHAFYTRRHCMQWNPVLSVLTHVEHGLVSKLAIEHLDCTPRSDLLALSTLTFSDWLNLLTLGVTLLTLFVYAVPHANAIRYVILGIATAIQWAVSWCCFISRYRQTPKSIDKEWDRLEELQVRQLEIQELVFKYRKLPSYASTFRSLQQQFGQTYFATRETNASAVRSRLGGGHKSGQYAKVMFNGSVPTLSLFNDNTNQPYQFEHDSRDPFQPVALYFPRDRDSFSHGNLRGGMKNDENNGEGTGNESLLLASGSHSQLHHQDNLFLSTSNLTATAHTTRSHQRGNGGTTSGANSPYLSAKHSPSTIGVAIPPTTSDIQSSTSMSNHYSSARAASQTPRHGAIPTGTTTATTTNNPPTTTTVTTTTTTATATTPSTNLLTTSQSQRGVITAPKRGGQYGRNQSNVGSFAVSSFASSNLGTLNSQDVMFGSSGTNPLFDKRATVAAQRGQNRGQLANNTINTTTTATITDQSSLGTNSLDASNNSSLDMIDTASIPTPHNTKNNTNTTTTTTTTAVTHNTPSSFQPQTFQPQSYLAPLPRDASFTNLPLPQSKTDVTGNSNGTQPSLHASSPVLPPDSGAGDYTPRLSFRMANNNHYNNNSSPNHHLNLRNNTNDLFTSQHTPSQTPSQTPRHGPNVDYQPRQLALSRTPSGVFSNQQQQHGSNSFLFGSSSANLPLPSSNTSDNILTHFPVTILIDNHYPAPRHRQNAKSLSSPLNSPPHDGLLRLRNREGLARNLGDSPSQRGYKGDSPSQRGHKGDSPSHRGRADSLSHRSRPERLGIPHGSNQRWAPMQGYL
jgi:hypothetical protein